MIEIQNVSKRYPTGIQANSNISFTVEPGEIVALVGPNGSGKTTLLRTIMGFSGYKITEGKIYFKGRDITDAPLDERARYGMGMMFQRPPTLSGLKLGKLLTAVANCSPESIGRYSPTCCAPVITLREQAAAKTETVINSKEINRVRIQKSIVVTNITFSCSISTTFAEK